ncbi:MAG: hypothetical protein V9E88_00905 [Ferruginibacter sp.]
MSIYKSGVGDELVNPENYNIEVIDYLDEEARILEMLISKFNTVIEAGCMTGRNLKLIHSLGKKYIGVDLERRYIIEAKLNFGSVENALFVCSDIINIEDVLINSKQSKETAVIVFPFNSFGNVNDNYTTLKCLLQQRFEIVIFTYRNDSVTNEVRKDYYKKSGFKNLVIEENADGVRFHDKTGLDSKAFSKYWFDNLGSQTNNIFYHNHFAKIGVAYFNFKVENLT